MRLEADGDPVPQKFIKQGSYAMRTMVQDPDNDYDIDDGVYFRQEDLKDDDGNDMSPQAVRKMVCDVLKDGRFVKQPQVKSSCVRIFYNEGYHVDMPIYRIRDVDGEYELAAGDKWVVSRAADVEDWFNDVNTTHSPDDTNGRQFRRIVRFIKKLARSRKSWKGQTANGFTITKLGEECYVPNGSREDIALRETMQAIHDRLQKSLEVDHPVTPGAKLTKGPNDECTEFLRDTLAESLAALEVLDKPDCSRADALAAWDTVYATTFFSQRNQVTKQEASASVGNMGILANLITTHENPRAVDKRGGGRFA